MSRIMWDFCVWRRVNEGISRLFTPFSYASKGGSFSPEVSIWMTKGAKLYKAWFRGLRMARERLSFRPKDTVAWISLVLAIRALFPYTTTTTTTRDQSYTRKICTYYYIMCSRASAETSISPSADLCHHPSKVFLSVFPTHHNKLQAVCMLWSFWIKMLWKEK